LALARNVQPAPVYALSVLRPGVVPFEVPMSYALQVRFVRLAPCEQLIALAAAHYKQMRRLLAGPGECTVSLERDPHQPQLTHAVVKVQHQGQARAQASASHAELEMALELALRDVHAQLGAPRALVEARGPAGEQYVEARGPAGEQYVAAGLGESAHQA
jgi:hypothetical protein